MDSLRPAAIHRIEEGAWIEVAEVPAAEFILPFLMVSGESYSKIYQDFSRF
jgi:hypothetical protein